MNDLSNSTSGPVPATRKDAATYMGLFPDASIRCAPGALQANTSQVAYLVYLKEMIEALEVRADVAAPVTLRQRRPDLLQLKLDEKSAKKAVPTLRLVLGLLESRASEALAAGQTLQQAVANATYQASVPFHPAWESVKTTLALKSLPLLDVLRTGDIDQPSFIFDNLTRPAQRAATTLSSGFSPELQARLLAANAADAPLKGLTTTQAVSKALGLTRKELRRLLAVNGTGKDSTSVTLSQHVSAADFYDVSSKYYAAEYVNSGETPLYLTQPDLTDRTVQITGVTDDHLVRMQRILHIQRALELKPAEADAVVMAAIWAEEPDDTANHTITANTLRALGLFRHLQQKYSISAYQYAAFIGEISVYGANGDRPFYNQLFAPQTTDEDSPAAPVLKLDGREFDPQATSGVDALTVKQLCLALKVDEPVLRAVLEWVVQAQGLTLPVRSIEVVSACYRLTALPRLFGMGPMEGMLALALLAQEDPAYKDQLAGTPSLGIDATQADIVDVIVGLMDTVEWMRQQSWGIDQLYLSLQSEFTPARPGWQSICEAQPLDPAAGETALHAALQQALQLENLELVPPLLRWTGLDTEAFRDNVYAIQRKHADEQLAPLACFTEEDIEDWALLDQYSAFVKLLELGAGTLKQIVDNPEWFDLLDATGTVLRDLDLSVTYLFSRYKALLTKLPQDRNENDVLHYLAGVDTSAHGPLAGGRIAKAWAELETLLGEAQGSLARLTSLTPPTTLGEIDRLLRLLDLSRQQRLSVDALVELGALPSALEHAPFQQAATALRKSCTAKQRTVLDEQFSVAWRDALVNWMLAKWVTADSQRSWITKPQALADYLLVDLLVSHEPRTTRVGSAIASLQRYLHQVHSRQENGYRDTVLDPAERDEWEQFASRYENWKLRQQVRNEPQNFIDPSRRTRKTEAFTELENLLAQGKCTPQDIQTAMLGYLSTFEHLSNIQPISAYADGTTPLKDTYHFIGKTNVEPAEYYWRTLDMTQLDTNNAPSMLAWGEWQKISLSISGKLATMPLRVKSRKDDKGNDIELTKAELELNKRFDGDSRNHTELIRPVMIAGRRYVVWVEREATAIPMGKDNKPSQYYALRVCFAFQQTDGAWSPPNELLRLDGHDEQGAFDPAKEPAPDPYGTALGNPFLKTRDYQPGLMVMVNINGDRLHDPWLTVLLFNAHSYAGISEPKRDGDYFIVMRDLLLIESKELDVENKSERPIERKLVTHWLEFFRDPRVVQHPYTGATTALDEIKEKRGDYAWATVQQEKIASQYTTNPLGQVRMDARLSGGLDTLEVNVVTDGAWQLKSGGWTIDTFDIAVPHCTKSAKLKIVACEMNASKIWIREVFTETDDTKNIVTIEKNYVKKLHEKLHEKPLSSSEYNTHQFAKLIADEYFIATIEYTPSADAEKCYFSEDLAIASASTSNPIALMEAQDIFSQNLSEPIYFESGVLKQDIEDNTRNKKHHQFLIPKDHTLSAIKITRTTSIESKLGSDNADSTITAPTVSYQNPSSHARLKAKLTARTSNHQNASWTLPHADLQRIETPPLNKLTPLAKEAKEKFSALKHALLRVRYVSKEVYDQSMGVPSTLKDDAWISVSEAIATARQQNKANAIIAFIKLEVEELKKAGITEADAFLDAALRLRHLEPETCNRILLYIDPTHEMTFEDTLVADGNGRATFHYPVNRDITEYTFDLKLYDDHVGTEALGSATRVYTLNDQPDDAVPSVQLSRNAEQALYLDLTEANAKAKADKTAAPSTQYLRLNTLFGKHLVALATQSVEQALSWDAQCLPEPRLDPDSTADTVDFSSANGFYFWELFLHVPFLVAWQLRQNREYRDAWRWCTQYLFDPYRTWAPAGNHPPPYWMTQPIIGAGAYAAGSATTDPDLLAYASPERYRKALHLFVAESWQRQGDDLYRQLTRDTLVEAAICYDKALRLIGVLPEQFSSALEQAKTLAEANNADFVPPLNNKLVELRDLLRNRLFNLRHGLTLDGKPAPVLLDPAMLNQVNLGYAGASQDTGQGIRESRPVPPSRYAEVRKSADAAVLQLIELGQTLLRFYDRESALQLSLLGKANLIKLLDFPYRLQEQALEAAKRGRDTLLSSRQMIQKRLDYYQGLVDEGITDLEHASRASGYISRLSLGIAIAMEASSGAIEATIPTIYGLAFGGNRPGKAAATSATCFRMLSEIGDMTKDELRLQADYQLRDEEWKFQAAQAQSELEILEKQLLEQDIHIRAARIAVEEARATQAAHRAEYEVMTTVFSSHPTYLWLIGRLSGIYSSAYDATLSLCLMAETCLQYELGDFRSTWITTDGWLDNWRGMLAGEALERDLIQMDVAAITNNERPLDIRLDLSICKVMGWTSAELQSHLKAGEILFDLTSRHFDEQYPGHYLRRIERIVLTFKNGTKSLSGSVAAMLTQTKNIVLLNNDYAGAQRLYSTSEGSVDNLLQILRLNQQAAIWSAKEITRNFDLQPSPKDETRYQPFEGTGAISSWVLSFPNADQADFLKSAPLYDEADGKCLVTDIEIEISYSAMDGGEKFRKQVKELLAKGKSGEVAEATKAEGLIKAEAKRKTDAAVTMQLKLDADAASAAEVKRKTDAAAAAEAKRKAEAAAAAEAKTKAEAAKKVADAKRKAEGEKKAAEAKSKAEAARKAAEAKRKAAANAAVTAAKQAELNAQAALKAAEADAQVPALSTPEATAEAIKAKDAVNEARKAVEQATTARKAAEATAKSGQYDETVSQATKAKQAAETALQAAKKAALAREAAEAINTKKQILKDILKKAKEWVGLADIKINYGSSSYITGILQSLDDIDAKVRFWDGKKHTSVTIKISEITNISKLR